MDGPRERLLSLGMRLGPEVPVGDGIPAGEPIRSIGFVWFTRSENRSRAAIRLIVGAIALAGAMAAQTIPATINTITQPTYGQAVFDAAGNAYYLFGPVTAGAAQTQSGGGVCFGARIIQEA